MKSFLILIDALRHDYITKELTPFLFKLRNKSKRAKVIETFAFQTRPSFFAGLHPEESGICNLFKYDPKNSPYSFLSSYSTLLTLFDKTKTDKLLRPIVRRLAKKIEENRGHVAAASVMTTERIPLSLLKYFSLSEQMRTEDEDVYGKNKTLFDELREKDKTWQWIGYPYHGGKSEEIMSAYKNAKESDLYYLHFSELDTLGHQFGPESSEIKESLSKLDFVIKDLLEAHIECGSSVVIFGDHGMAKVQHSLNLMSIINNLGLREEKDYLAFYDSTQARFWFHNEHSKNVITEKLSRLNEGHIVDEQEKAELKIRFKDRSYGDLLFVLDQPGIIHPSYFVRSGDGPKGMHGYLPHVKDNMTEVFGYSQDVKNENLGTIEMIEIYQIIKDILL